MLHIFSAEFYKKLPMQIHSALYICAENMRQTFVLLQAISFFIFSLQFLAKNSKGLET